MRYTYTPKNVCPMKFIADIENNIINDFQIIGGCPGNTQAVSKLIIGQKIVDVIPKLKGIMCGNKKTSCPDQISKFLSDVLKNKH